MIRIAITKFYQKKIVPNEEEALKKLVDEHLLPHSVHYNNRKYRREVIWEMRVDNILKAFKPLF